MKTREVRYVECEYCRGHSPVACIVCGGRGYVELVVWVEKEEEKEDEGQEVS